MRNGPVFYRRFSLTGAVLNVGLLDGLGMGLLGWWHYECDDDYGSFPKMPCVSLAPVSWLHFWNVAATCGGFSLSHVFSKTAAVLFLNLGPLNSMFFSHHMFSNKESVPEAAFLENLKYHVMLMIMIIKINIYIYISHDVPQLCPVKFHQLKWLADFYD